MGQKMYGLLVRLGITSEVLREDLQGYETNAMI